MRSTLRVPSETLIVVPLTNGLADRKGIVHLPLTPIGEGEFAPYKVTAKCGTEGVVYAHAGLFAASVVCWSCEVGRISPRKGTKATYRRHKWTEAEVVASVQRWDMENGRPPARADWVRRGAWHPSERTVMQMWPSWGDAIRAAGLEPKSRPVAAPLGCDGSVRSYWRGCRCDECRASHAADQRRRTAA